MKLNNKRTILIGFAFLSISAFWQMYDTIIPLILRDTFGVGDSLSGWIMALDNVFALFMLPLFGKISDKVGRRMPFIVGGTAAAVILNMLLSVLNVPGRLPLFFVVLGLLLIAMGTYRSPAVALMPDVTPKPLRSKANAIINLMGALGGVFTLLVIKVFGGAPEGERANYFPVFLAVSALMVIAVTVVSRKVDERKLRAEVPQEPEEEKQEATGGKLPPEMMRSLALILCSVSLWFMGYNAVTTAYSKYFTRMWGDLSGAASCLMIATVGAVVSYIPVGMISSKIGRKKMILLGVTVLTTCFALAGTVKVFTFGVYVLFVLIGFAWASINVNSYPMVVEISKGSDVGKYTGLYYTFSMSAQILTPVVSGWLLEHVGYHTLFPYAACMTGAAFITMLFVKHGDNRPEKAKSLLENFDVDD
ncbi:MAG: SLC45 family MFS transporter [Clostridiales bacterium]|nr:SLC45 family MFS transporter [Clostridiales bacterium]